MEAYTIPHLNDEHKWTREQIADWVESYEGNSLEGVLCLSESSA